MIQIVHTVMAIRTHHLSAAELEALTLAALDDDNSNFSTATTESYTSMPNKKRAREEDHEHEGKVFRQKLSEDGKYVYATSQPTPTPTPYSKYRYFSVTEEEAISTKLKQTIPDTLIKKRAGPGGTRLSYISGGICLNNLNEVFGFNGWSSKVKKTDIFEKDGSYQVIVLMQITLRDGTTRQDYGFGSSKNDIEKAIKEATTDAIKRAAHQFGNYLGGQLYK